MNELAEQTHYINKKLNTTLNLIGLSEERSLYILIKALKNRYNQCLHWKYEDKEIDFIEDEDGNMLVKRFSIPAYDVKTAFKKAKIHFEDTKELFESLPMILKRHMPNGGIRRGSLFNEIYYNPDYEHFEINVNEMFYELIKLENLHMDSYFKVYHNEFFKLTGKHARSMYRLASMFEQNKIFTHNISTLRQYFKQQKSETKVFMRDVINKSILEVEKKTNFKITYKKIKKGKQLDKLLFTITRTKNK